MAAAAAIGRGLLRRLGSCAAAAAAAGGSGRLAPLGRAAAASSSARSASSDATAVVYSERGAPGTVLRLQQLPAGAPGPGEVLVSMLAAPINPSDINMILGTYPLLPPLPAVAGSEGVGAVAAVGPGVDDLAPGDRVVLTRPGLGTWRRALICSRRDLMAVPPDIALEAAAMASVNPPTALRLLADFAPPLRRGDLVAQNGANSAVGRAVIQLAAARGLRSLNLIRDRPGHEEVAAELSELLGADLVLTEAEARSPAGRAAIAALGPPAALGLNGVGGRSAGALARLLAPGGTLVTYGGMAREPLSLPTGEFIFRDLTARGFWLTRWSEAAAPAARAAMFAEVWAALRSGALRPPPLERVPLAGAAAAAEAAAAPAGARGVKTLLVMDPGA